MKLPLVALVLAPFALSISQDNEDPLPDFEPEVTKAEIEHHVRFLASDELRGRRAGTADAHRAAAYLGRALEAAGLEPGGDDGGFLQAYRVLSETHTEAPRLTFETAAGEKVEARFGRDYTLRVRGLAIDLPAVRIRIVRSIEDLPERSNPKEALLVDGTGAERREWLREREMGDAREWGALLLLGSKTEGPEEARLPRGRPQRVGGADAADHITVRGPLRARLKAGEFVSMSVDYTLERDELVDHNVIGILRGVGTMDQPELADEAIVLSAHYDHIGEGGRGEDTIRNGADDDASGVSAVLELAGAFGPSGTGPPSARTLVFLLAGGEEQGLWGTNHYLDHPVVPLENTVANLNFEMIGRPDELVGGAGKLWLTGFELTTLGPAYQERGFDVVADQRLDQNFFRRSDNYAFVMRGIVGQTLSSYNMHQDYHRASDEADTLDFDHMEACVRAGLDAARMLADGSLTPEWLPGKEPSR